MVRSLDKHGLHKGWKNLNAPKRYITLIIIPLNKMKIIDWLIKMQHRNVSKSVPLSLNHHIF